MNAIVTTAPAVSVIIPAHNAEATLGDALDSLIAQTVSAWEAIVVDDASSDGTARVARAYAEKEPRIRLLSVRAGTAAAARNAGLVLARGRRLLFLDADDWIAPTHLERLGAMLAASPGATAAYCGFMRVAPDGTMTPPTWRSDIATDPVLAFARRPGTAIHAVLVDRDAVSAIGGFDPTLPICEDWDFWYRLARNGVRFVGAPEPLAFYRMRADSLSHRHERLLQDGLIVLRRNFAALDGSCDGWQAQASYLAIWCAAAEIGAGRDGIPLLEASGLDILPGNDVDALSDTVVEGLVVGAARTAPSLASIWADVAGRLGALLQWLERKDGRPGLARKLTYGVELHVLAACDPAASIVLGQVMTAPIDLRHIVPLATPPGIDLALLRIIDGQEVLRSVQRPVLGPLAARDVVDLAIEALWVGTVWRRSGATRRPRLWCSAAWAAAPLVMRAIAGRLLPTRFSRSTGGLRSIARAALASAMKQAAGPPPGPASNSQMLAGIRRRAEQLAAQLTRPETPCGGLAQDRGEPAQATDRRGCREALFETSDPGDDEAVHETEKHRRTLELLPAAPIGNALELACGDGRFTRLLAPRVGALLATDIDDREIARAAERCAGATNIEFRRLDLEADPLPSDLDLIVCSEVLHDLPDEAALRNVTEKMRDALAIGGHLVTAHAFVPAQDQTRTGFDWKQPFGAATIARIFAQTPGLVTERAVETESYRIASFRRDHIGLVQPAALETVPLAASPSPDVARQLVRGGAEARRTVVQQREAAHAVPVLMYHRIGEDGPPRLARFRVSPSQFDAQLRLLRRRGYHAISSAALRWYMDERQPIAGRPVLITFDDGYRDFLDLAWPILRANDFTAEVFVPTDLVGTAATWDAAYGTPSPLLGWDELAELARQGVVIGSHLASHADGLGLSTIALAEELARSRAVLEARLGQQVRTFAAPYGSLDERFARLAAGIGYQLGFSTRHGHAQLDDPPLMLPRIEVPGDWDLDSFANAMMPSR